jgi:ribosomal-protein-serine acetyltransferase
MSYAISRCVGGNWRYRVNPSAKPSAKSSANPSKRRAATPLAAPGAQPAIRPAADQARQPRFAIGPGTTLELIDHDDADALLALVEESRAHLEVWLPGLKHRIRDRVSAREFVMVVKREQRRGRALHFGIWHHDQLAGVVSLEQIHGQRKHAAVGYWAHQRYLGRGLITASVAALCRHGIETLGLGRIEISADVDNLRSRRVAERLGFQFEGVLRCRDRIEGQYIDHAVYSLTVRDSLPRPVRLDAT